MYRLINSVFALAVVVFALTASAARGNEVGERALAKADSLYALQQYEAAVKFYKVAADSGVVGLSRVMACAVSVPPVSMICCISGALVSAFSASRSVMMT